MHKSCLFGYLLFGRCFSKNISVWKPFDLDHVLYHGVNLMKSLKAFQLLAVDELPLPVNIEGCCIKVRKLMLYRDIRVYSMLLVYFFNINK